jgi:hypothetical protein
LKTSRRRPVRLHQLRRVRQTPTQADVPADGPDHVPAGGLDVPADDLGGPAFRADVPDGRDGAALLHLRPYRRWRRHEPGAVNRAGSEARRFHAPCR